jgi:uroporphyrinogen-III synthase
MQRQSNPDALPAAVTDAATGSTNAPLVILTRPQAASERFAARLRVALGRQSSVQIMIAPLQRIRHLDWALPEGQPAALIFTSQNAVEAAARAGLSGWAYCVGDQTAEAAQNAGFTAISAQGDAADLVRLIGAAGSSAAGSNAAGPGALWHLRGRAAQGDVAGQLRRAGFEVSEVIVYDMEAVAPSVEVLAALCGTRPIVLPLFSPKSARRAVAALGGGTVPLQVVALSVAVELAAEGLTRRDNWVCERPDADGMVEILKKVLNSGSLP